MNKHNKYLSVCIPTYNGEAKIKENLEHFIPIAKKHSIPIYISDNASIDNTQQVVAEFIKEYEFIYYFKNEENLGADKNFEKILKTSDAKYSWLLGNDDLILEESVEKILDYASSEQEYSMITLNCSGAKDKSNPRIVGKESKIYSDYNEWMQDLASHLTWMSALIFNRDVIANIDWETYYNTWFLQTAVCYNGAARSSLPVVWISDVCVIFASSFSQEYSTGTFYTFTTRLFGIAQLFDKAYRKKIRKIFVRHHYIYGPLHLSAFSFRLSKQLNLFKFIKYHRAIRWAMPFKGRVNMFFKCLIPLSIIKWAKARRAKKRDKGLI